MYDKSRTTFSVSFLQEDKEKERFCYSVLRPLILSHFLNLSFPQQTSWRASLYYEFPMTASISSI